MQPDELENLLRRWGRVFGEPPPSEWDEEKSGTETGSTHALVQAARSDGLSVLKMNMTLAKLRDKLRRQRRESILGEKLLKGYHDPRELMEEHRCYGFETRGGRKPMHVDPVADWVDRTAVQLYENDQTLAVVLRIEYCTRGRHRDKLPRVQSILENPRMSLRQYRQHLDQARAWMDGALSVKKRA